MLVKDPPPTANQPGTFKNSLTRTVVVTILLLTVIPVVAILAVMFLRTRNVLQNMVSHQLRTIVESYSVQLEDLAATRATLLDQTVDDLAVQYDLSNILSTPKDTLKAEEARSRLTEIFTDIIRDPGERTFDHMLMISPDGEVLVSTNYAWVGLDLSTMPNYPGFEGENGSILAYDAWPLYPSKLVIFTHRRYVDRRSGEEAVVIGAVLNPLPMSLLESARTFFPSGESYFFTSANQLIGIHPTKQDFSLFDSPPSQAKQLQALLDTPSAGGVATELAEGESLAFAQPIPSLNAVFLVAAPKAAAYQSVRALIPFSGLLLLIYLMAVGGLLYSSVARLVRPLLVLADKAGRFAKGDWSQRAEVNRTDEIGLLADTFNRMVADISALYQSLEEKVEERTRQLRTATEVATIATSAVERHEMLRRTVELLRSRFGYQYAAAFLIDETGSYAVLHAVASVSEEAQKLLGSRVPISQQNALGQVATTKTPLIISDTAVETSQPGRTLLAGTRSQLILPIASGQQVFGVLDIQSATKNSFDPETVSVLQSLASQIATGLRNIQVMDSTQINLEESTQLSRFGRQITKAATQDEVVQILTDSLAQTSLVTSVFKIEPEVLRLLTLHDPAQAEQDADLHGLEFPLLADMDRLSDGNPIVINDLQQVEDLEPIYRLMRRQKCHHAAALPVLKNGAPAYLLVLGAYEQRPLTSTRLQPFLNLAEIVGNTIERVELVAALRQRLFELETVTTIGETISAEINLERVFEVLHEQVCERMGADLSLGIALYHPDQQTIEIPFITAGSERLHIDPMPLGDGLTSYIIKNREPLMIVHDVDRRMKELGAKIVGDPAKSWLGVPLISAGDVLGAMIVQDVETEGRFTEDDFKLFTTLAPIVANILRNIRLLSEMQQAIQSYDQERFLLNSLLDNIPEQVYFKDRAGRYIRVSRSFAEQFDQREPADLIGMTDIDLRGPEVGAQSYEQDQALIDANQSVIGQIEAQPGPDGDNWMLTSKIPLCDSAGEPVGLLGLAQDITDLKRAERLMERRARQIQTASEVARDTSGTLEVDEILRRAVELIRDRFRFYHASIYLKGPASDYLVLREASGEIGQRLKEAGYRLAVGSKSLIGRASATEQPVVVNNVFEDPGYFANPLTPETKSEAVIPMISGDQLLGVLDVQSDHFDAFLEEDIHTLQILADQLAAAVMNANLFTRMQAHLAKHRMLHQITSEATASEELSQALRTIVSGLSAVLPDVQISVFLVNEDGELQVRESFGYDRTDLTHLRIPFGRGVVGMVAQEKRSIRIDDTSTDPRYVAYEDGIRSEIAVPILYSDEVIGVLNIESPHLAAFDESDQEILGTLGNNLGAIIANTRLLAQVRQQTERQRKLFEIASKIRRSVDIESILKISTEELARVMNAHRARIELGTGSASPPHSETADGQRSNGKNGSEAVL